MIRHALLFLAVLIVGCDKPKPHLRLLIWPEYLDPSIVASFEEKFGCEVSLDFVDDNEAMMAKLAAGGVSSYDIVMPANYVMPALVRRGLLAPLRHANIPNLRNLEPQLANQPWDPNNQYSAPYQWGTIGLFVRKQQGKPIDETWDLVFDPAKQPGPFLLLEDYRACLDLAVRVRGHPPNTTNATELSEARDLLIQVKSRARGFANSISSCNQLLSKDATLVMAYSSDAIRRMKEDPDVHYFIPREGCNYYVDNLSIPAQAPQRDLAEKFINYILDAKVGAQLSEFNFAATPNKSALPLIRPEMRNNPALYPPPDVMRLLWTSRDLAEANRLYDEAWTQIKAK